jgi:hypothetical protein
MASTPGTTGRATAAQPARARVPELPITETRRSFKTTELMAYVGAVAAVLIAAAVADGFGAQDAWLYVTILTAGYMLSRGLAKAGSPEWDPSEVDRGEGDRFERAP